MSIDLLELVKEVVSDPIPEGHPDFDWSPIVFALSGEDPVVLEFENRFLEDKPLWRRTLTQAIGDSGANELVLLTSTWVSDLKRAEDESREQFEKRAMNTLPSESPDRREAVMLVYVSADGGETMCFASIERDGVSSPTLGEWIENPGMAQGPTIDALRAGLR